MSGTHDGRPQGLRVRRGRVLAALVALVVTMVAVLGAVGILPQDGPAAAASGENGAGEGDRAALEAFEPLGDPTRSGSTSKVGPRSETADSGGGMVEDTSLPADSGSGKRVVFDIGDQRVWLVEKDDEVRRTYLVSGSVTDNLKPGSYAVYSTSRWAVGIDDSGVMEYFVRFTRGQNAAIGFHSIPTKKGRALQTRAQLGTPQSHGCIRQWKPDAERLWDFAPVGTKVVVTA